ncbi:MAG: choice-of-anchor E domain-containing protein [Luteolibacter sp.]|jgi:hypothetical protein|nr:choice-of-anchor E domain-containing protein [Luteolibacter sp.]
MKALHPILLAMSLAGVGHAASIVQTKTFTFVPEDTAPLTFNQFDSSLGTLTSIVITTSLTKSGGSLFVDNESATPASGNINQSVTITLSSSAVSLIDTSLQPIGNGIAATSVYFANVGADDGDGPGVQSVGADYDGTSFSEVSAGQTRNVNEIAWSGYTGLGTYLIDANGVQGFNTSAIGGAAVAIDPATASGEVSITYNFNAVPEPSAALMGAVGLLALLRRHRS